MHIDIEGQPGSGVTFIYSILNFAHIEPHRMQYRRRAVTERVEAVVR